VSGAGRRLLGEIDGQSNDQAEALVKQ